MTELPLHNTGRGLMENKSSGRGAAFMAAQGGRLILWLPVAMACGIGLWFSLAATPGALTYGITAAAVLICGLAVRFVPSLSVTAAMLAAMLAGFLWVGARAEMQDGPRVMRETPPLAIKGTVVDVSLRDHGARRVILTDMSVGDLWGRAATAMPDGLPDKARVTIRYGGVGLVPGMVINTKLILRPPPGPVIPGGFDFARTAWFDGIGGVGFALGRPEIVGVVPAGLNGVMVQARLAIADHINARLSGDQAALAIALLTGFRGPVDEAVLDDLRIAGLAHLLAISGLHIGLVAGGVFVMLRLLLVAAWLLIGTRLRQRDWPAKQIAAGGALLAAAIYLGLSGMNVPAERAFIMTGLALVAVMMNRIALSMRLVAWAALAIMIMRPDSVMSAGFQMSFAAVTALIAFYEAIRTRTALLFGDTWGTKLRGYVIGLLLTSVIAGLATGPVAAFHFGRVAVFGLLGNLAAMPIMGFVIMPAGIIALVLMPFGLAGIWLELMGAGIAWVTLAAGFVADLPLSERLIATGPTYVLALLFAGLVCLCLIKGAGRLVGIVPALLGVLLWTTGTPPQILIAEQAALVLVDQQDAAPQITQTRKHDYTQSHWLRALGYDAGSSQRASCDRVGCRFALPHGGHLAQLFQREGLVEACQNAAILVAPFRVYGKTCPGPLIIDTGVLAGQDSISITIVGGDMTQHTAAQHAPRYELTHSETTRHARHWGISSNPSYLQDRLKAVAVWNGQARLRAAQTR